MAMSGTANRVRFFIGTAVTILYICFLSVLFVPAALAGSPDDSPALIWGQEDSDELSAYGDDNSGTRFALEDAIVTQGRKSAAVIPGGSSVEAKIALELSGDRLKRWISQNSDAVLNTYLPQVNAHNPTMFFLGIADITDTWSWIGGIFSPTQAKPGWNQIRYPVGKVMTDLDPSRKYNVFLAFAAIEGDRKIPMTEKFYIDGIYKEHDPAKPVQGKAVSPEIAKEVQKVRAMGDDKLLDTLSKKTFDYFWYEANSANGLIKDRSTKDSFCSIAAVGFGLSAIPIGVERGWISRNQGYKRALTTLKTFWDGGVEGKNGFFYHFVDMKTGRRHAGVELSSIDTALFIAGALTAGEYFKGTEAEELSRKLYDNIDWQWMQNGEDTLSMGWTPEGGFLKARWNEFNESMVMYILAIGSRNHPISPAAWDKIHRPVMNGHIALPDEVLFIYQYSHAWVDFRDKEDKYANYWNNSISATLYNRDYCISKAGSVNGYGPDIWGLSASDGPGGYRAYGARDGNNDGTIAPYAPVASMPFTPDLSMSALRAMLDKYGPYIWGKYGLVSAFNDKYSWFSEEHIGIDQGDILLMVENYRTGLIWKMFMAIPEVKRGMDLIGFTDKKSDYAVNPSY